MPVTEDERIESLDGVSLDATRTTPEGPPRARVLLLHGITSEKGEEGKYERLAERLAGDGFESLRFSFRGHGASDGKQEAVTIAGELTDLFSVLRHLNALDTPLAAVVASSFGAVSLLSLLAKLPPFCRRLVLWNPVLDLDDTFLHPSPPWGRRNFGWDRVWEAMRRDGVVKVDGAFRLPAVLFLEMERYDVEESFRHVDVPILAIHGTADSFVSFRVTERACAASSHAELVAIDGSDHGFQRPEEEARAREATSVFLLPEGGP